MAPTPRFELLDLSRNRAIAPPELERCAALVAALVAARGPAPQAGDERRWTTVDGDPAFGGLTPYSLDRYDAAFVPVLRLHAFVFTACHLTDLVSGARTPSWLDAVAAAFPGDWPDWSIPAFRHYTRGLPAHLVARPPLVAGEIGFEVDGVCVNRDQIALQERLNLLHRNGVLDHLQRRPRPRILEIGGGYGGLAHALTRLVPQASYTILDLPSALMFSGCYLSVAQSSHGVRVHDPATRDAPPETPPEIELVVNTAAADLRDRHFDLAINTMSFAEMAPEVVAGYGTLIRDTLAPGGVLFEQNFSLGDQRAGSFCSPDQVLARLFAGRDDLPGTHIWGRARLWSAAPFA
jgi:hypothetical protein